MVHKKPVMVDSNPRLITFCQPLYVLYLEKLLKNSDFCYNFHKVWFILSISQEKASKTIEMA